MDGQSQPHRDETIASRSRTVCQRLADLIALVQNRQDDSSHPAVVAHAAVTDALERFMLWAGSLGALRNPSARISLDSRLAAAPDIRAHICQQLDDILEATDDCESRETISGHGSDGPTVLTRQ